MNIISYSALVVTVDNQNRVYRSVKKKNLEELPPDGVIIDVSYSSLNYKDALSADGNRSVTRRYPHVPGIDSVGTVHASSVEHFKAGDQVLCMGYDLGMNTDGGFGQYIAVPASWVMALPSAITPLESMQIGTAGFTAAQCVDRLIELGVQPNKGPILVTGATGGVGSLAVRLLSALHFDVTAVTGKMAYQDFLLNLGASSIIERSRFLANTKKMMLRERWAGVVETTGGDILATAIKGTRYGGVVTCCGNAASADLPINVYPFILRGVTLAGIDSAQCSMAKRQTIWNKLAGPWRLTGLDDLCRLIALPQLEQEIDNMLTGKAKGRVVVTMEET